MTLEWIQEQPAYWDDDKVRIIGEAPAGIFDNRFRRLKPKELVPGEWWRVADGNRTVAFGWLDVVWGDAEILLATAADARDKGVGTFVLEHLETEAKKRGLNYLYNVVRPTHPQGDAITRWLVARGFVAKEDGSLVRAVKK